MAKNSKKGNQLTDRQRLFVDAYLETLNATEAARRAGYQAKSEGVFRAIGHENLTKPNLKAIIDERLKRSTMSADEVLQRLTRQAQGVDPTDFVKLKPVFDIDDDGNQVLLGEMVSIDIEDIRRRGLGHLIKKIKPTARGVEVEWHDSQTALQLLGKYHGLFKEQMEHSGEVILKVIRGDAKTDDDPSV